MSYLISWEFPKLLSRLFLAKPVLACNVCSISRKNGVFRSLFQSKKAFSRGLHGTVEGIVMKLCSFYPDRSLVVHFGQSLGKYVTFWVNCSPRKPSVQVFMAPWKEYSWNSLICLEGIQWKMFFDLPKISRAFEYGFSIRIGPCLYILCNLSENWGLSESIVAQESVQ